MDFYVYVLENNTGKIYIGQTYDLEKRLKEHNEIGFGYTSKHRPWKLIYQEIYKTRKEAMNREKYF